MGSFSNAYELKVLNHIFKTAVLTPATHLYVALTKSTIDDTKTGSTLPSEVSGGAYAREQCDTWDSASSGSTKNTAPIIYEQATADWGVVTDFAITTHLTTGDVVGYGKLGSAKTIDSGDIPKFATGDLKVSLD